MSARSGIRFYRTDKVVEVNLPTVEAIRDELEKIAAANPPRPDIDGLLEALKIHVIDLDVEVDVRSPTFTLDDRCDLDQQWRAILLRATDHLRNLGHKEDDLIELRDMLVYGVKPVSYRFRSAKGDLAFGFTSYSGVYGVNDRLVREDRSEWRIIGFECRDPLEFTVDAWRPAE